MSRVLAEHPYTLSSERRRASGVVRPRRVAEARPLAETRTARSESGSRQLLAESKGCSDFITITATTSKWNARPRSVACSRCWRSRRSCRAGSPDLFLKRPDGTRPMYAASTSALSAALSGTTCSFSRILPWRYPAPGLAPAIKPAGRRSWPAPAADRRLMTLRVPLGAVASRRHEEPRRSRRIFYTRSASWSSYGFRDSVKKMFAGSHRGKAHTLSGLGF